MITAIGKGRAYIYAKEDGTKVRMTVTVKEKIKLQEAEQNYGLHDRQSADHNQRDNQRKILMMHIYNDIIERMMENRRIILYGEE